MRDPIDWNVLARYLANSCSPDETRAVKAWLDADPTRHQLLNELESIWAASNQPASPLDEATLDADWDQLAAAMDEAASPVSPPSTRRTRQPARRRAQRAGRPTLQNALYVLLAGLLLVGSLWVGLDRWSPDAPADPVRMVVAERGERANIQLVDGTKVTLNVDSRLRMPTAFDGGRREVHLEGEAYFDVAPDSARPFIVHANDAVINVHGTAFNVRSYPEDRRVQVAVVEGAVSLRAQTASPDDAGARLERGQVGRLDQEAVRVQTDSTRSVVPLLGWMEGRLVFEDATLDVVTARLERWYNLQFEVTDPGLDSLRLTANLKSRSVQNVLDVISASLGIRYRLQHNTVILADDPSGPPPQHN